MTLAFNKAEFPTLTRNRKANEYTGLVQEMIDTGEARSTTLSVKNDEERKAVADLIYAVQSAGRELGVSVRKAVTENADKKTATVTFITREKITRERKTAPVPATEDKPVAAKPGPARSRTNKK